METAALRSTPDGRTCSAHYRPQYCTRKVRVMGRPLMRPLESRH